jgi:dienelactone hydrolase
MLNRALRLSVLLPAFLFLAGSILADDKPAPDTRLTKVRTLDDLDFDMKVPASKEEWEKRRKELREQVLVSQGLWPLPEKTPLNPTVHGKIDRDEYTIEKVFFASYPGHYVNGNLYVPKGKSGKLPVVLCPHGHWQNGRLCEIDEKAAKKLVEGGGEKTLEGARYHLQARCAMLARMGCVVFHYDMVGVADSKAIDHREGFKDAQADLRLQSFMGLQTWNSIRALDYVLSLPNVDPERIGITGASGGGTQTFILCAIDDRISAAFPAVMVSTQMQGGCVCENAPYLRQDTGNIDIAAIFAPKPLGMTGAHDWTINIEKKGLPELKQVYKLYDAEDRVMAKCFPQFDHNYNQVSREVMYNWFNKYLKLGWKEPVEEKPFTPVLPKELSVYDKEHPRPKDEVNAEKLRQYLTEASDKQMAALAPKDAKRLEEYRRVVRTALGVMVHDRYPGKDAIFKVKAWIGKGRVGSGLADEGYIGRKGEGDMVHVTRVTPKITSSAGPLTDAIVVWVHPDGAKSLSDKLATAAEKIVESQQILVVEPLLTGDSADVKPTTVDPNFSGFTFGYNRPLLANRVHDIVTAIAFAKQQARKVYVMGFDEAGPWALLAAALCGDNVTRTAVDFRGFRFEQVTSSKDPMMLPGALKYGGLPGLGALCAPNELLVHNTKGCGSLTALADAYKAAGAEKALEPHEEKLGADDVVKWLLRK